MSDPDSAAVFRFRRADLGDLESIVCFNLRLAEETEEKTLDRETLRAGVSRGMRLFPEAQYFVAEIEGSVIGQLMLTREWSDWRNGWMLWLQSVYVQREFRCQAVFSRLLSCALDTANADGKAVGLRLYVEQKNAVANEAYRKMGFDDAGYRILEMVPLSCDSKTNT
ncbi:MAG: GNAT family N-acetyltransferase [Fuerstiella sp.]|nr:GNAT family N-acetyltransferase [Fuerstiella sp.]